MRRTGEDGPRGPEQPTPGLSGTVLIVDDDESICLQRLCSQQWRGGIGARGAMAPLK